MDTAAEECKENAVPLAATPGKTEGAPTPSKKKAEAEVVKVDMEMTTKAEEEDEVDGASVGKVEEMAEDKEEEEEEVVQDEEEEEKKEVEADAPIEEEAAEDHTATTEAAPAQEQDMEHQDMEHQDVAVNNTAVVEEEEEDDDANESFSVSDTSSHDNLNETANQSLMNTSLAMAQRSMFLSDDDEEDEDEDDEEEEALDDDHEGSAVMALEVSAVSEDGDDANQTEDAMESDENQEEQPAEQVMESDDAPPASPTHAAQDAEHEAQPKTPAAAQTPKYPATPQGRAQLEALRAKWADVDVATLTPAKVAARAADLAEVQAIKAAWGNPVTTPGLKKMKQRHAVRGASFGGYSLQVKEAETFMAHIRKYEVDSAADAAALGIDVLSHAMLTGDKEAVAALLQNLTTTNNNSSNNNIEEEEKEEEEASLAPFTTNQLDGNRMTFSKDQAHGRSCLVFASALGYTDVLTCFIDTFETNLVEHADAYRNSVLSYAAFYGQTETTKLLIERCPALLFEKNNRQQDAFFWAVYRNAAASMSLMHTAEPAFAKQEYEHGFQPVHLSCLVGSHDALALLVEWGAEVEALTATATTPLMFAVAAGFVDGVTFLLDSGAQMDALDSREINAIAYAVLSRHPEVLTALLTHGLCLPTPQLKHALAHQSFNCPIVPLIAYWNLAEMMETMLNPAWGLIERGFLDVNARSRAEANSVYGGQFTAAMMVTLSQNNFDNQVRILRALERVGADFTLECRFGATALDIAAQYDVSEDGRVVAELHRILAEKGVEVEKPELARLAIKPPKTTVKDWCKSRDHHSKGSSRSTSNSNSSTSGVASKRKLHTTAFGATMTTKKKAPSSRPTKRPNRVPGAPPVGGRPSKMMHKAQTEEEEAPAGGSVLGARLGDDIRILQTLHEGATLTKYKRGAGLGPRRHNRYFRMDIASCALMWHTEQWALDKKAPKKLRRALVTDVTEGRSGVDPAKDAEKHRLALSVDLDDGTMLELVFASPQERSVWLQGIRLAINQKRLEMEVEKDNKTKAKGGK